MTTTKENYDADLSELEALKIEAAGARLESAQHLVNTRQLELDAIVKEVMGPLTEGGKYKVTGINTKERKAVRELAAPFPAPAAEQSSAQTDGGDQPKG